MLHNSAIYRSMVSFNIPNEKLFATFQTSLLHVNWTDVIVLLCIIVENQKKKRNKLKKKNL